MSVKERKLYQIDQRILKLKTLEGQALEGFSKRIAQAKTWLHCLYFEFLKNDVAIRAESLSYFTLFSMMPLMAGVFFLFSIFARFSQVQTEFENMVQNFLRAIPDDQRETLVNFIYQFKDQYLARLSSESSSIGIFALAALAYVAGKVFFNLESLMNRIWAVKRDRPLLERVRNFVFCLVIFPLAYIAALSLPGIIEHFGEKKLGLFLHQGIPSLIFFSSLAFIFRYFPNTRVQWKSAFIGALFTSICFVISSFVLSFYFRFGTSTAYGKVAVLPIFAFFIYVAWLLFILGVEVSLLCQSGDLFDGARFPQTTLSQALLLECVVLEFARRFREGDGAVGMREICKVLHATSTDIELILRFLRKQNVIAVVSKLKNDENATHVLIREVRDDNMIGLVKEFLDINEISQNFDVSSLLSRLK